MTAEQTNEIGSILFVFGCIWISCSVLIAGFGYINYAEIGVLIGVLKISAAWGLTS
jgi:hypothetical protein